MMIKLNNYDAYESFIKSSISTKRIMTSENRYRKIYKDVSKIQFAIDIDRDTVYIFDGANIKKFDGFTEKRSSSNHDAVTWYRVDLLEDLLSSKDNFTVDPSTMDVATVSFHTFARWFSEGEIKYSYGYDYSEESGLKVIVTANVFGYKVKKLYDPEYINITKATINETRFGYEIWFRADFGYYDQEWSDKLFKRSFKVTLPEAPFKHYDGDPIDTTVKDPVALFPSGYKYIANGYMYKARENKGFVKMKYDYAGTRNVRETTSESDFAFGPNAAAFSTERSEKVYNIGDEEINVTPEEIFEIVPEKDDFYKVAQIVIK